MTEILTPVEKQLAAYNKGDIEGFAPNFSENCLIEDGEGNLIMQGRQAIYTSYKEMFAQSPNLHCRLASRTIVGNYVLDEERVTGRMGSTEEAHVIAIYRVENGMIVHVRFLK